MNPRLANGLAQLAYLANNMVNEKMLGAQDRSSPSGPVLQLSRKGAPTLRQCLNRPCDPRESLPALDRPPNK